MLTWKWNTREIPRQPTVPHKSAIHAHVCLCRIRDWVTGNNGTTQLIPAWARLWALGAEQNLSLVTSYGCAINDGNSLRWWLSEGSDKDGCPAQIKTKWCHLVLGGTSNGFLWMHFFKRASHCRVLKCHVNTLERSHSRNHLFYTSSIIAWYQKFDLGFSWKSRRLSDLRWWRWPIKWPKRIISAFLKKTISWLEKSGFFKVNECIWWSGLRPCLYICTPVDNCLVNYGVLFGLHEEQLVAMAANVTSNPIKLLLRRPQWLCWGKEL